MLTFVLENHRIRDKYVQKILYTFSTNKIIFTNGERKKERPNFLGMFSQNLPISLAFIVILKMEYAYSTQVATSCRHVDCA